MTSLGEALERPVEYMDAPELFCLDLYKEFDVPSLSAVTPTHRPFRAGDVRHSQADIGKARRLLGYAPTHRLADGIRSALPWYLAHHGVVPAREARFAGAT